MATAPTTAFPTSPSFAPHAIGCTTSTCFQQTLVIRLRDEKRKARWSKLTKDAAKKAIETMRKTPGRLGAIAKKAAATRRARKSGGTV